ncbi:MAG: hypothetical protein WCO56_21645 [Verrucomicrobiota bacterium]
MKNEFLKPRFTGARFDEHTLPVDVARDLAAYEELVIELAKHLWLADNPGRERVPRGFEKGFSLHLEGMVEAGSAKPLLSCVVAGALALQGGNNEYFGQARDLIADCISASAAGQVLPTKFPKELLDHFNVFGRSLREGEALELPRAGGAAQLTPERRKQLVLDAQRVYSKDVELTGCVGEIDWEKQTFRLRLDTGSAVTVPLPEHFRELARQAGGRERTRVLIKGVGVFDAYDHLQKLAETQHLELQPNQTLADQIDELAALKDGWLEGQGKAPDKDQLAWATDKLVASFPESLPFPHVGPTPEGGLFLEWIHTPWRISAEILLPSHQCELQATHTTTGTMVDKDCDLDQTNAWRELYAFVCDHLSQS